MPSGGLQSTAGLSCTWKGRPSEIGYQHGYLLASEIQEMKAIAGLELKHDTEKDWAFFRNAARDMMWPRIEQEYRDELQGITNGVTRAACSSICGTSLR